MFYSVSPRWNYRRINDLVSKDGSSSYGVAVAIAAAKARDHVFVPRLGFPFFPLLSFLFPINVQNGGHPIDANIVTRMGLPHEGLLGISKPGILLLLIIISRVT